LNTLSKINACSGASGLPDGEGMRSIIAVSISSIPIPLLPLANKISSGLQPIF
jgi:hypothetical protein